MTPSKIWLAAVLSVTLVACGDKPPSSPKLSDVFSRLPVPPQASFVSRSGGADAIQITVRTPLRPDVIATYYRSVFKTDEWKLINDAKDKDGAVVLFAQRQNRPLWVRVRLDKGSGGSLVDLAGAVVAEDSAKIPAAAGGKPTS
jgi:hypothetical protein